MNGEIKKSRPAGFIETDKASKPAGFSERDKASKPAGFSETDKKSEPADFLNLLHLKERLSALALAEGKAEMAVSFSAAAAAGVQKYTERDVTAALKSAANGIIELLFPPALYCVCCGNLIDETRTYHLCDHCLSHIRWDGREVAEIHGLKTLSCTRYGLYERSLVFALKYNGKKYIARELAEMMRDRLSLAEAEFDVIIPVPMFWEKERQRGFNHAALMGKYLGKLTGKPCLPHGLLRTEDTMPMRGLGPVERRNNVKDKFACSEKYVKMLKGKRVLLIDDFYTTGSTAGECFRALKTAGPADVLFLAFAARY